MKMVNGKRNNQGNNFLISSWKSNVSPHIWNNWLYHEQDYFPLSTLLSELVIHFSYQLRYLFFQKS